MFNPTNGLTILVENAIKHVIENIKTKAQLNIDITNKYELLLIEVGNPVANSGCLLKALTLV